MSKKITRLFLMVLTLVLGFARTEAAIVSPAETPGVSQNAKPALTKHRSKNKWKKFKRNDSSQNTWNDPQQDVSDQTEVSEQSDHHAKKRK